jgi:nicotinamidase-related amidase
MLTTITIEATPHPIVLEPARAAVIVVDMQNDYGSKGGMFDRMGIALDGFAQAADRTAQVLACARQSGFTIIYLAMGFLPDLSNLGPEGAPSRVRHLACGVGETMTAPDGRQSRILIRDNWGTDIVPAVAPQEADLVVHKHRYSGFYQTELESLLRTRGIDQLVFTGCTTSVCVESTLRDAYFRDFQVVLLHDCVYEPIGMSLSRSNQDATITLVEMLFGWVSGSTEFIEACQATKALPQGTAGARQ